MDTSEITIPNDITYLPAVQAYAEEVSRLLGFNKKDISMILLALEEAVTNVIKHAFEKGENATFKIIFKPKSTCLTIIVKDKGLPYEPELIHDFNIDEAFEHKSAPGLGSLLMKKSVDEVSFYNLGREGKELHLTKYLPFKKITAYRTLEEIEAFPPITKTVSKSDTPIKTEIRLMKPDEAIEVSRLFYRCYGYSYFMDAICYPDKLARRDCWAFGGIAVREQFKDSRSGHGSYKTIFPRSWEHGENGFFSYGRVQKGRIGRSFRRGGLFSYVFSKGRLCQRI